MTIFGLLAKLTLKLIAEKAPALLKPWPTNSPDLNLIENLWAIVSEKVYQKPVHTVVSLKKRVCAAWRALDPDILTNLVLDMPNRMQEVIDAKGGAIHR